MRVTIFPKTRLGTWTVVLGILSFLVFALWQIDLAWEHHRQDVWERLNPLLSQYPHPPVPEVFNPNLINYAASILCAATVVVGTISLVKERSLTVPLAMIACLLLLLRILGTSFPLQLPF